MLLLLPTVCTARKTNTSQAVPKGPENLHLARSQTLTKIGVVKTCGVDADDDRPGADPSLSNTLGFLFSFESDREREFSTVTNRRGSLLLMFSHLAAGKESKRYRRRTTWTGEPSAFARRDIWSLFWHHLT